MVLFLLEKVLLTRIKFIIYGRNVIRLKSRNILIAEDDVNINNLLKEALEREGYVCRQAFSGTEAVLLLERMMYRLYCLTLCFRG